MTSRPGRFTVVGFSLLAVLAAAFPTACALPGAKATPAVLPPVDEPAPGVAATPRPVGTPRPTPTPDPVLPGRGVPAATAWLLHRGPVAQLGDLAKVAATYPLVVVEADPALNRATAAQIQALQAGGRTKVLAWLSVGAVEASRPVWQKYASVVEAASLGPRAGRPEETWIDPGDAPLAKILVDQLAKPLAATGVDGFLVGDADLAEHLADAADGPCDAGCRQGVLEVLARLRAAFPDKLLVVQGAAGDVIRLGTDGTQKPIAGLLDGVVADQVYAPAYDADAERELLAWRDMKLELAGRPFFLGTNDVVAGCATAAVGDAARRARENGFAPAVGDAAGPTRKACPLP
jgi:cysteinyl-tRNA synthetase